MPVAPILGHADALARLWGALERDALHHAYLFEGPRGAGKHAVALKLAMAANCVAEGPPGDRPCGVCPPCKQISAGNHPDVIVLEPAADRATPVIPVDAVREVVRVAGYHRYNSKRRMVIIDPAEAMQPAAANALLKTLEEPPEGTGFILVANHASALLPTIVSRCQRVRFGAVAEDDIVDWLVSKGQEATHARAAARLSLGCPGQALSLARGGLAERSDLRQTMLGIVDGGPPAIFQWTERAGRGARQQTMARAEQLIAVIEDLLRDVAVLGSGSDLPLLNADAPEVVQQWTRALWPTGITSITAAIHEAREQMLVNVQTRLVMDALLLEVRAQVVR